MLQEQLSGDMIQQLSQQVGATPEQTAQATNGIFAALVGGLAQNSSTPTGLGALSSALDKDHDGSLLDDVFGLISGNINQDNRASNGTGILGHILGQNQQQVAQQLSKSSGLDMSQIMKLMPIIAPIVMGLLGKMRSNSNSSGGGGILDLAQILMGSAKSAQTGGFGDIIGTVLGGVLSNQGQAQAPQSSAGGLLGTIFGKLFKR